MTSFSPGAGVILVLAGLSSLAMWQRPETIWPGKNRVFVVRHAQRYEPVMIFRHLLADREFLLAARNTLVYMLGSLFVQLPVALELATLLNRPGLSGAPFSGSSFLRRRWSGWFSQP